MVINPWSTELYNGESLLWSYVFSTKGIIRVKVTGRMVVTNFRAFTIDEENHVVDGYVMLFAVDDVIVMNTRRVSNSIGYSVYSGRYGGFAGPRFSSGTSKTIGDIVFIINGKSYTWGGIPDPTGLKNFVKAIKKTIYDPLTKLQNKSPRAGNICPGCGSHNPRSSNFCTGCGISLVNECPNCGKANPLNSSFCGKCGSPITINITIDRTQGTETSENHENHV